MTANRYTIAPHISSIAPVVKVLDGPIGLVLNAGVGSWFMVHGSWFMVHGFWFIVHGYTGFGIQGLCSRE
jgi:hypothetical protein